MAAHFLYLYQTLSKETSCTFWEPLCYLWDLKTEGKQVKKMRLGNKIVGLNCLLPLQSKYNPFFRNSSKGVLCDLTYQQINFPFSFQFPSKIPYLIFFQSEFTSSFSSTSFPQGFLRVCRKGAAEWHLNAANTYSLCVPLNTSAKSTDHHTFSLPVSTAEPILLPVSEYGFVLPHASATELFACFWVTKSFAWGARKIYGFG